MTDTIEATAEQTAPPTKKQRQAARLADAASGRNRWIIFKIAMLAIVDAVALYAVAVLLLHGEWLVLGLVVAVTVLVNWIYFSRKHIPAKYLTPGIILLVVFQIFTLCYTAYIGFTNYGTGHNGSQDQAIASLMRSSLVRVEDSPTFDVAVVERVGVLGLLVTDPDRRRGERRHEHRAAASRRRRHDGGRQGRRRRRLGHPDLRRGPQPQQRDRGARGRRTATTPTTGRSARRTARRATCTSRRSSTTRSPTR